MNESDCEERVGYTPKQTVQSVDEELFDRDGEFRWEFYLKHGGDLTAVDVPIEIEFVSNGKTVTDDLGEEYQEEWDEHSVSVPPYAERLVTDQGLEIPDGWDIENVELDVTVGEPGYWCTPKNVEGEE